MSEQDRVTCPFCGTTIHQALHPSPIMVTGDFPGELSCPLSGYSFSWEQWTMRPPKKEAPQGKAILSEVEWLRGIVAAMLPKDPNQEVIVNYDRIGQYVYATGEAAKKK